MRVFFNLLLLPLCLDQRCTPFAISTPFIPQGQRQSFLFRKTVEIIRGSFKIFPESIYLWEMQYSTISLISFKIVPSFNYTLLPATVKGLETFLKPFYESFFQLFPRTRIDVSNVTQAPSLQCWFQSTEQVKISWSHVKTVWGMLYCCHIVLC
jgi:hypothetical protein